MMKTRVFLRIVITTLLTAQGLPAAAAVALQDNPDGSMSAANPASVASPANPTNSADSANPAINNSVNSADSANTTNSANAISKSTNPTSENAIVAKTTAPSQTSESAVSRIIPQAALEVSSLAGDDTSSFSSKTGLSVGATADIGHSNLVFETGLLYRQMGANLSGVYVNGMAADSAELDLNYISFPLLGKIYFNNPKESTAYFKAGFMPQILASQSAVVKFNGMTMSNSGLGVNSLDFDVLFGLGGKVNITEKTSMFVEAAYLKGLTKLESNVDAYNSGLTLSAGLGFDL